MILMDGHSGGKTGNGDWHTANGYTTYCEPNRWPTAKWTRATPQPPKPKPRNPQAAAQICLLKKMLWLLGCTTETGSLRLYIHVYIPLVGVSVEKTPAGCILGRHHTSVQATQHGHHIVLDGTCSCEVLKELRPAVEPHSFMWFTITNELRFFLSVCVLTCFLCTRRLLHSQTL